MADLARVDANPYAMHVAAGRGSEPNPLMLIPADWRPSVSLLWATNAHLIPSALVLCARLRLYSERGLTGEDVRGIVAGLTDPAVAAKHRFAGDLLADLAGRADRAMRERRERERVAERRAVGGASGEAWTAARLAADLGTLNPTE